MRTATLYTLKQEKILVEGTSVVLANPMRYAGFGFTHKGDDSITSMDCTRIDIPVQHIKRYVGPFVGFQEEIETEDMFIAVHPEVEEVITVRVREQLEKTQKRVEALQHQIKNVNDWFDRLQALPWWKRMWCGLTGNYRC